MAVVNDSGKGGRGGPRCEAPGRSAVNVVSCVKPAKVNKRFCQLFITRLRSVAQSVFGSLVSTSTVLQRKNWARLVCMYTFSTCNTETVLSF